MLLNFLLDKATVKCFACKTFVYAVVENAIKCLPSTHMQRLQDALRVCVNDLEPSSTGMLLLKSIMNDTYYS